MAIKSIEVICRPCAKCRDLETILRELVKVISLEHRIAIIFDFKYTPDLRALEKYSLNASQTPAILINGQVEFAGRNDRILLKRKLEAIHREG